MRFCKGCNTNKDESNFYYRVKHGYRSKCNTCSLEEMRAKYQKPWTKKLTAYKKLDKKKGFICDISSEWYEKNIHGKSCYYCGSVDNIGCDRLDNNKGHTMNNVVPCCWKCNNIRGTYFTPEQMKKLAEFIKTL